MVVQTHGEPGYLASCGSELRMRLEEARGGRPLGTPARDGLLGRPPRRMHIGPHTEGGGLIVPITPILGPLGHCDATDLDCSLSLAIIILGGSSKIRTKWLGKMQQPARNGHLPRPVPTLAGGLVPTFVTRRPAWKRGLDLSSKI